MTSTAQRVLRCLKAFELHTQPPPAGAGVGRACSLRRRVRDFFPCSSSSSAKLPDAGRKEFLRFWIAAAAGPACGAAATGYARPRRASFLEPSPIHSDAIYFSTTTLLFHPLFCPVQAPPTLLLVPDHTATTRHYACIAPAAPSHKPTCFRPLLSFSFSTAQRSSNLGTPPSHTHVNGNTLSTPRSGLCGCSPSLHHVPHSQRHKRLQWPPEAIGLAASHARRQELEDQDKLSDYIPVSADLSRAPTASASVSRAQTPPSKRDNDTDASDDDDDQLEDDGDVSMSSPSKTARQLEKQREKEERAAARKHGKAVKAAQDETLASTRESMAKAKLADSFKTIRLPPRPDRALPALYRHQEGA
ncbi:hypothetical protein L1887_62393 [Cichorium endivia]|nr:hypothetical protein L1887_62393 [Cichorium endivia]